jgi:site-specific recombinase XerD
MAGSALIVRSEGALISAEIGGLEADAAQFASASKADATKRAYASDWADFTAWCAGLQLDPLPASGYTVGLYLTHSAKAGRAVSTVGRRAAAIASIHRAAGENNPCARGEVKDILSGIRRTLGRAPNKKQALTVDLIGKVIRRIRGDDPISIRDRAMILLCFGAALRRSELVRLQVDDVEVHRRGLMVHLRKSKTDQEGRGRKVAVPDGKLKIPAAVKAWVRASGVSEGYLFPAANRGQEEILHFSETHFARMLKARCQAAGLDPADISGHSPRRGFATTAGDEGEDLRRTARHMRHVKLETTLGYMEDGELFRENVGASFL